jgi:hypothetical protein
MRLLRGRAAFAAVLASGWVLGAGCAIDGTIVYSVRCETPAAEVVPCEQTGVGVVEFCFLDPASTSICASTQGLVCYPDCLPATFSLALGPYLLRASGAAFRHADGGPEYVTCFVSDEQRVEVLGGQTQTFDVLLKRRDVNLETCDRLP